MTITGFDVLQSVPFLGERKQRLGQQCPGRDLDGGLLRPRDKQLAVDPNVVPNIEKLESIEHILADAGYRGHNAPGIYKLRVFTTGQKRRITPAIKRLMKRRAAVEPVIGHLKNGHRMDRNYLAHRQGDAINPILAAAGYNFRLILKWIRLLWLYFWVTLRGAQSAKTA